MAQMAVGSVAALWRFPVKSMSGESLQEVEVTSRGVLGDRAFALIDVETVKVASAKSVRLFPNLLECRAAFIEPPQSGRGLPPVRVTLPDGSTVTSASPEVDSVLSDYVGRAVRLAHAAPPDFTIDQYHPDVEDADPAGYRDTVVEQKLGSAFFAQAGMDSPVPVGAFFDLFPMTLLTTSTLRRLAELRPASRFDERRFRMNVVVATDGTGFLENEWIGREVSLGGTARLHAALPDPRCVMTTLAQGDLPQDTEVLRTLTRHNRIPVGPAGQFPCAGVYAVVTVPGTLRTSDRVTLM